MQTPFKLGVVKFDSIYHAQTGWFWENRKAPTRIYSPESLDKNTFWLSNIVTRQSLKGFPHIVSQHFLELKFDDLAVLGMDSFTNNVDIINCKRQRANILSIWRSFFCWLTNYNANFKNNPKRITSRYNALSDYIAIALDPKIDLDTDDLLADDCKLIQQQSILQKASRFNRNPYARNIKLHVFNRAQNILSMPVPVSQNSSATHTLEIQKIHIVQVHDMLNKLIKLKDRSILVSQKQKIFIEKYAQTHLENSTFVPAIPLIQLFNKEMQVALSRMPFSIEPIIEKALLKAFSSDLLNFRAKNSFTVDYIHSQALSIICQKALAFINSDIVIQSINEDLSIDLLVDSEALKKAHPVILKGQFDQGIYRRILSEILSTDFTVRSVGSHVQ